MIKRPQAIILAAGKGTRMEPLSCSQDKPFLEILGKSILEHNLEQLNGLVDKVILVIRPGVRGQEIIKKFGLKYKKTPIKYIVQRQALGTGDAVNSAKQLLKEKFILLNGDDFYHRQDIQNVLKKFPCILAKEVESPQFFGVLFLLKNYLKELEEKPKNPSSNLVNTGLYYLPAFILDFSIKKSSRGEYEFTDYIKNFIKKEKLYCVKAEKWTSVSFPWNILEASRDILSEEKEKNQGKIEKYCNLSGKVIIGKGTLIKSGAYIEGPVKIGKNCTIGPNCFIRKFTIIGNDCRVGQGAEIKNSVIGNNVSVAHFSYIGDSVIADKCNIGAGTITANWRHDALTIKSEVKGELIDTGRDKLGAVLGEGVKTGINTLIYPGRKIWPNKTTFPGEIVKKDIK